VFNESKYTTYYYGIINKAKNRILSDNIYTEKHHIIPKSLGGSNLQTNLIILTLREHFVCHWLLTKMFDNKNNKIKMHHALWNMINTRKNVKISSRLYEQLKMKHYQTIQGSQVGEKNGFYGKHHDEETKWKCGARTRGKTYEDVYGSEKADEIKQKQSKSKKGKSTWNKGIPSTQEVRNKIRTTIKKNKQNNKVFKWWKITMPDQSIQITKDRRQFCEEHNLNYNTINDYSQKQKSYKGYYFEKTLPPTHFGN